MLLSFVLAAVSATAIAQAPLQPWAALIGHCWVSEAPVGGSIDKHCFESVFGGQHIRDRHVVTVRGRDVYAGETLYSARGSQVIFTYWNSLGGLGTGTAVVMGAEWRFSGTIHATATGAEQPIKAVWKVNPQSYEVTANGGPPTLFKRAD